MIGSFCYVKGPWLAPSAVQGLSGRASYGGREDKEGGFAGSTRGALALALSVKETFVLVFVIFQSLPSMIKSLSRRSISPLAVVQPSINLLHRINVARLGRRSFVAN